MSKVGRLAVSLEMVALHVFLCAGIIQNVGETAVALSNLVSFHF
jgi:hypothetical protein